MSELNIPHAPYAIFKKPFWQPKVAQLTTNYTFNGSSLGDIPNDLLYLLEAIEKSKYILARMKR